MKDQIFYLCMLVTLNFAFGQQQKSGPIIEEYGKVWPVPDANYILDTSKELKVVFDVYASPTNKTKLNSSIATAARFLNMHAQNGVPKSKMHVALVVHGQASENLLRNSVHIAKHKTNNPNEDLIQKLLDAGVQIILCGQSANSRSIKLEDLIPEIKLSLSAMTALIQLQNNDYRLIKF